VIYEFSEETISDRSLVIYSPAIVMFMLGYLFFRIFDSWPFVGYEN
jgi:hypothetical protein